jgi:hypothetical protein
MGAVRWGGAAGELYWNFAGDCDDQQMRRTSWLERTRFQPLGPVDTSYGSQIGADFGG